MLSDLELATRWCWSRTSGPSACWLSGSMLDKLLEYHELPEPDEFVIAVMQGVAREQRLRRMILMLSGLVGTAFGLLDAYLLAGPLAPLMPQLLAADTAAASGLVLFLVVTVLAWLLHDEPGMPA